MNEIDTRSINDIQIVLVGGPGDGLFAPKTPHIQYFTRDHECIYRAEKYVSGYPIPGWDFQIVEDVSLGEKGKEPWWTTRVWALPDRHVEINSHTQILNMRILAAFSCRVFHSYEPAVDQDLEEAIQELISLTTPGRP